MNPGPTAPAEMPSPSPAQLNPYLSLTLLECVDDPATAFRELTDFLDEAARRRGRAVSCLPSTPHVFDAHDRIPEVGALESFGLDQLHIGTRQLIRRPSWAARQDEVFDVVHELTVAARWQQLIAVAGESPSESRLRGWADARPGRFRFIPYAVLAASFTGDHVGLWTRGIHQRRNTKEDSKTVTGMRLQDALNPREDGDFAVSAAAVDHLPDDAAAIVRNRVVLSPQRSRISWRATPDLGEFLRAVREVLNAVGKVLAAGEPEWQFGLRPEPERDVTKVRLAVDVVLAPEDGEPADVDEEEARCTEFLRDAELTVTGSEHGPEATMQVTAGGRTTAVELTPVVERDGARFEVRTPGGTAHPELRGLAGHLRSGHLLRVVYGSGHSCNGRDLHRRNITSSPFGNFQFEDFTGFVLDREKPPVGGDENIHQQIGEHDDDSLFSWVVGRYRDGWLLCDDGSGEVADFLHLNDDGLTAIHVKAARAGTARQVSLGPFEQLTAQAVKNTRLLERDLLLDRLRDRLAIRPWSACWRDGVRVSAADFLAELNRQRLAGDTYVRLIQPHLSRSALHAASDAAGRNPSSPQAYRLQLLNDLLNSTRHSVIGNCRDLFVVAGS